MGYDAEKFKARANTKAGNIWLILKQWMEKNNYKIKM